MIIRENILDLSRKVYLACYHLCFSVQRIELLKSRGEMQLSRNKKNHQARWIAVIFIWTFVLSVILGFFARFFVGAGYPLTISILILLAVISLGIIFDMIGTSAAAADIAPLNAKAARKVFGARRSVYLVQHAGQVANFCNDVVGDISGIISGTLTAIIVLRMARYLSFEVMEMYAGILLAALVASMTVGGKAWGKSVAIRRSTEVMLLVGKLLTHLESPVRWFNWLRRGELR